MWGNEQPVIINYRKVYVRYVKVPQMQLGTRAQRKLRSGDHTLLITATHHCQSLPYLPHLPLIISHSPSQSPHSPQPIPAVLITV